MNNPRNLRSSVWANGTFCFFCAKKERVSCWTKGLLGANRTFSFLNKVAVKNKNNRKKKKTALQKQARFAFQSSSYSNNVIPFLSKAAPRQVQFQQNKLVASRRTQKATNKKKEGSFGFRAKSEEQAFGVNAKVLTPFWSKDQKCLKTLWF